MAIRIGEERVVVAPFDMDSLHFCAGATFIIMGNHDALPHLVGCDVSEDFLKHADGSPYAGSSFRTVLHHCETMINGEFSRLTPDRTGYWITDSLINNNTRPAFKNPSWEV